MKVVGRVYCQAHGRLLVAAAKAQSEADAAAARLLQAEHRHAMLARREQARADLPQVLAQLKAAGSPGSQRVAFTTWEYKTGLLAGAWGWWSGGRSRYDLTTTLNAWNLKTARVLRHDSRGPDSGTNRSVSAMVSDEGHYFFTTEGRPDQSGIMLPAEVILRQWADPASQTETGPFKTADREFSSLTWEKVEETLRGYLPAK